jgi:hypothetical protein
MQVKLGYIMSPDLNGLHPELVKFLNFNAKHAGLRYDLQSKLAKAVVKEVESLQEQRVKLCEAYSIEKEIEIDGEKKKTKLVVVEKDGKLVEGDKYDIPQEKNADFDRELNELLDNEVEISAYPISLKKLESEADTSALNFFYLEPFIKDDRE